MTMKFSEKQKCSVFSLLLCSTWYFQDIFVTGENQAILLHKVSSHGLVEMETTPCLIKTVNVLNRLECTYRCNNQLPECAAIYYNDVLGLCKLLRCRPTDKLGIQNLVGIPSEWEIWEDTQACKIGWALFAGHCYYFRAIETTWNHALAYCNSSGSSLIEIYSQTEEDWVKDSFLLPKTGVDIQCPRISSCSLWIGSSRNPITSNFSYNSGKPILYPKWDLFEPDNRRGNENCVALFRLQKLHDLACNLYDFQYICKMKT